MKRLLIISDLENTSNVFANHLSNEYQITVSNRIDEAIERHQKEIFDFLFIDLTNLKDFKTGPLEKSLFQERFNLLVKFFPTSRKVLMAERRMTQDCILAVKCGLDNYISYPLIVDEIKFVLELEYETLKQEFIAKHFEEKSFNPLSKYQLTSKSKTMQTVFEQVQSVAETKSTVLITGESGTGKSVLAKMIHDLSNRKNEKFISVHCGAISEGLIESELFGHEKGAFTGAIKRKLGKFELANKGTIFLDEIGTISRAAQVSLLQVLQERFIQRVGGEEDIEVDVRIIAATNEDLKSSVSEKNFREDLYFRLNVFPVEIPSLSERKEDIEDFCEHILKKLNATHGKNIDAIHPETMFSFQGYSWPGNIRELENVIERAYILEKTKIITTDHIPLGITKNQDQPKTIVSLFPSLNLSEARRHTLDAFERNYILELLKSSNGNLKVASKLSGVTIRQLHKFISKHQVNRKEFCLQEDLEVYEQTIR